MRRSISRISVRYWLRRGAIRRAEVLAEARHFAGDPVEDALVGAAALRALGRRGADAEQRIEHRARVANHRQRLLGRRPADAVGVGAAVTVGAAAGLIDRLDRQLHRGDRRVLAELLRIQLIERRAGEHVGALRLLGMRLRQEHRARAEVIGADFRQRERFGVADVGVADDRQVVAERLERRQRARAQVERGADFSGRPHVLAEAELGGAGRAVHHLDRRQAHLLRRGRRPGERRRRGRHRIEDRQRHRDAKAAQHRAARHVLLRQELHLRSPNQANQANRANRPISYRLRFFSLLPSSVVVTSSARRHLERAAVHHSQHEGREAVVVLGRVADDLANRGHVEMLDAAAEAVGHQALREAGEEHVLVLQQRRAQAVRAGHLRAVVEIADRIDEVAVVANAPAAGDVEVLEREAERIDHAMAGVALRIGAMLLHALARRQHHVAGFGLGLVERRHVRRRRRRRRREQHFHDPLAAQHRRGAIGDRGQREDAALPEQAAAVLVGQRHAAGNSSPLMFGMP